MQLSDDVQRQSKALADPSRFQLFTYISDAARPVGVAELTDLMGFNHNAIRQHLTVLVDAGLVSEANERGGGRGRPRKLYAARDDALSAFAGISGGYRRLADILLDLAANDITPYEAGRRRGAQAHTTAPGDLITALTDRLAVEGFEPAPVDDNSTELHNCPFADLAERNPAVICEIHRGLIDGYLANNTVSNGATAVKLVTRPARSAGCTVSLASDENDQS